MKKTTRKAIFLRNFAWLLSIWLVLMLGFSVYLMYGERMAARKNFLEDAFERALSKLESDRLWTKEDYRLIDSVTSLKKFGFETQNLELAIYSEDLELLYVTGNTWIVHYTARGENSSFTQEDLFFHPGKWFSNEDITELVSLLNYKPENPGPGILDGYMLQIEGWRVGDELIPGKLVAEPMYPQGPIGTPFSTPEEMPTPEDRFVLYSGYDEDYSRVVNLERVNQAFGRYFDNAWRYTRPEDSGTMAMVTDMERLSAAFDEVMSGDISWITDLADQTWKGEPTRLFSERYYAAFPYPAIINETSIDCDFWFVAAGETNFLLNIWKSLLAVWLICLFVFSGAAYILSAQSWQTHRKRAALEQQRRDTTNAIAHDLKTPLSAISGYAENLMYEVHTEKRDYYAERIVENVRRMDGILREMLSLSRLDAGAQRISPETLDLEALTQEAARPYRDTLFERGVRLSIEGTGELTADRGLMLRTLDNFLSNAACHSPEGGRVTIAIGPGRWSIENTGNQIPEDQLKTIWRAYYKADTARSREGSGLGLSIVKAIMELHGFDCGAENTETGVRFWFSY